MMPFSKEQAKPFREALLDDQSRHDLAALLKKHAPGKVRYTLPALYAIGDIDWALRGRSYWAHDDPRRRQRTTAGRRRAREASMGAARFKADAQLRLIALPTLGVHVPGIEHWVQWDVRYRKVDSDMLTPVGELIARRPWARSRKPPYSPEGTMSRSGKHGSRWP